MALCVSKPRAECRAHFANVLVTCVDGRVVGVQVRHSRGGANIRPGVAKLRRLHEAGVALAVWSRWVPTTLETPLIQSTHSVRH